jgi:serine/threonine protein kinase
MQADIVIKQLIPSKDRKDANFEYLSGKIKEEATMLYRLSFKGLPKVMDFFEEQDNFFLTMQYIEGEDLDQHLEAQPGKKADFKTSVIWLDRILEVVSFLHNQNPPIIHRDIKPKNIMLDKSGELYLVDFNIACFLSENKSSYTKAGTVEYAPPESFTGKIDQRSDIYSMGATFFHLMTGVSPADREHPASFPPIRNFVPEIPESVEAIINKMTSFSKNDRYSSCNEIREALRQDPVVAGLLAGIEILPVQVQTQTNGNGISKPESLKQDKIEKVHTNDQVTEIIDNSHKVKGRQENYQKKEHSRTIWIAALLTAFLLFTAFYFLRQTFGIKTIRPQTRPVSYTVTALSTGKSDISEMTQIANAKKFNAKMKLHIKDEQHGTTFKVITYFDNRSDSVFALKSIKEQGFDAVLRENPIDGITIQVKGDFATNEKAQSALEEISKKLPKQTFYVVEKPINLPIPIYEIIVSNIQTPDKANELKQEFMKFSSDVRIINR